MGCQLHFYIGHHILRTLGHVVVGFPQPTQLEGTVSYAGIRLWGRPLLAWCEGITFPPIPVASLAVMTFPIHQGHVCSVVLSSAGFLWLFITCRCPLLLLWQGRSRRDGGGEERGGSKVNMSKRSHMNRQWYGCNGPHDIKYLELLNKPTKTEFSCFCVWR